MPMVFVHRVPPETVNIERLLETIQVAVASVEQLHLTREQVTVFVPADLVKKGLGEEVICEVRGLFTKPERTHDVLAILAYVLDDALRRFVHNNLPNCRLIEVLVYPFDEQVGAFRTSTPHRRD